MRILQSPTALHILPLVTMHVGPSAAMVAGTLVVPVVVEVGTPCCFPPNDFWVMAMVVVVAVVVITVVVVVVVAVTVVTVEVSFMHTV